MKTKMVFGNAHTPEAIERFQRENAEKIEELITSGALDRPATDNNKPADQNQHTKPRPQRKAA